MILKPAESIYHYRESCGIARGLLKFAPQHVGVAATMAEAEGKVPILERCNGC